MDGRDGELYRIEVHYAGADPRIRLRQQERLTDEEFESVRRRLDRLDVASATGAWTRNILRSIRRHPRLPARELAERLGVTKAWLKPNVRKLKNLGLTISHRLGDEISPRGQAVLERLESR